MSKGRWEPWEEQWLKQHWKTTSDVDIAEKLGRDDKSIARKRKLMGLIKSNGRPSNDSKNEATLDSPTPYSLSKLNRDDRIKFYKASFKTHWRYKLIKRTLLDDELGYYEHRYIEFIDTNDITLIEEDLLHNMIMCDIQIIRIQNLLRDTLKKYNEDDDDDKRPPPNYLYKDLGDAEGRYVKYQEKLNLTRQQRMKDNREEDITISSVVKELLDKKNRRAADKLAGELDFFNRSARDEMNAMDFLIGGD